MASVGTAGRSSPKRRDGEIRRWAYGIALVPLVALALAACAPGPTPGPAPDRGLRGSLRLPHGAREARVVRVVDGDTLVLTRLGSSRLIGVDAPEIRGRGECFAGEATAFVRRLVSAGSRVRFSLGEDPRDRYGRALVYVWFGDGRSLNALLLEGGYATVLTIPPNDRYAQRFRRLAREARREGRGRWSEACAGRT